VKGGPAIPEIRRKLEELGFCRAAGSSADELRVIKNARSADQIRGGDQKKDGAFANEKKTAGSGPAVPI